MEPDVCLKRARQVVQNFFRKAVRIISQSRDARYHVPAGYGDEVQRWDKWFSIEIPILEDLEEQQDMPLMSWFAPAHSDVPQFQDMTLTIKLWLDPSRLNVNDVLTSRAEDEDKPRLVPKDAKILLETWSLFFSDCCTFDPASLSEALPGIYKKLILLFRSLFTLCHLVPSATSQLWLSEVRGVLDLEISKCEGKSSDLSHQLLALDKPASKFSFDRIPSPFGTFAIQVTYRNPCLYSIRDAATDNEPSIIRATSTLEGEDTAKFGPKNPTTASTPRLVYHWDTIDHKAPSDVEGDTKCVSLVDSDAQSDPARVEKSQAKEMQPGIASSDLAFSDREIHGIRANALSALKPSSLSSRQESAEAYYGVHVANRSPYVDYTNPDRSPRSAPYSNTARSSQERRGSDGMMKAPTRNDHRHEIVRQFDREEEDRERLQDRKDYILRRQQRERRAAQEAGETEERRREHVKLLYEALVAEQEYLSKEDLWKGLEEMMKVDDRGRPKEKSRQVYDHTRPGTDRTPRRAQSMVSSRNSSLRGNDRFENDYQKTRPRRGSAVSGNSYAIDQTEARFPPLPEKEIAASTYRCDLCGLEIKITRKRDWQRHVISDVEPYICLELDCNTPDVTYPSMRLFEEHYSLAHPQAPILTDPNVECIFCDETLPKTSKARLTHLAHHLEAVAFNASPSVLEEWKFYSGSDSDQQDVVEDPKSPGRMLWERVKTAINHDGVADDFTLSRKVSLSPQQAADELVEESFDKRRYHE